MSLFLITFFLLYGAMHSYLVVKAHNAFGFSLRTLIPLIFVMLVMVFSPVFVRMSEKAGFTGPALPMAYATYVWMGFLFLFFCSSFCLDIGRLVIYLAGLATGRTLFPAALADRLQFYLAFSLALVIAVYGFVEAGSIRTEHIAIKTDKLSQQVGALRIVQISDVHLGLVAREARLKDIVDKVKQADPDILVSTGDLLDGQTDSLGAMAPLLDEVRPRFGKFAITGNHEFYAGLGNFTTFAEKAGFRVLRGEGTAIEGVINVAGVDDVAGRPIGLYRGVEEKALLSCLGPGRFNLLLKHRPDIDPGSVGFFDLQLSGHTHDGQIFPFAYVVKRFFPMVAGRFPLGKNSELYVSRGTGTWGPPIRFLAPPEITVIELRSGEKANQF